MNNTNKFLSNLRDFDAPVIEEEIIEEEEIDLEPPPPVFSEDDMEAAKAMAHASGRNEAIQEERDSRDQLLATTLQDISNSFASLFAAEIYREKQYEEESVKIALELIDILAPSLQTRLGEEALKNSLKDVLKSQSEQGEIKVEVHPETATDIERLIDDIWPDKECAPRYKITADNSLEIGACKLSWKDGGMIRDPNKTAQNMKSVLEALLVDQVLPPNNANAPEQVTKTKISALTDDQNNAINKEEASDSVSKSGKDDLTGDIKND